VIADIKGRRLFFLEVHYGFGMIYLHTLCKLNNRA